MATTVVQLESDTWTLLSSTKAQVQNLSQSDLLVNEAASLPTSEDVYTLLVPKKIYSYEKVTGENLYGYCKNDCEVSVTEVL